MVNKKNSDETKNTKHLKLEPLDIDKFIKANELKPISNPMFFERTGSPTSDGLLSNEIFGITKDDRTSIFSYIHLAGETFMHPLAYKIWNRLDKNVKMCAYEMENYVLDKKNGKLIPDPNGKTGLKYLKEVIKVIDFKKNDSAKRGTKIDFLEKYRDKLFIDNFVVIPAGYRDIDTEKSGRMGVGEINKLYNAIIRDCNALAQSEDYGLTLNGSIRGRIQDNIAAVYDWLVFGRFNGKDAEASGLSSKMGLIRRAGMKKSFDWGARLVICQQNLRKERLSDLDVDVDEIGLPLAAICANLYPFMLYWIRNFFEVNFSDEMYLTTVDKKTGKKKYNVVQDWRTIYSDERIKKELDRFMHGSVNRFIPIEAPVNDGFKGTTPYLRIKGYYVDSDEKAQEIINGNIPKEEKLLDRAMTWCDLIYMAAIDICKDKYTLITRFPIDSYWNQYPARIKVFSTIETEPVVVENGVIGRRYYPKFPKIRPEDMNKNSSNKFVDVAVPNNVRLDSIGGDFDGDTISSKIPYSIEANEELGKLIDSKRYFVGLEGINEMNATKEAIQSVYNLTMVLPEDKDKLSQPKFAIPPKYADAYKADREAYEKKNKK